jgi:hypothetical protein
LRTFLKSLLLALTLISCKEPYNIPEQAQNADLLVVDAFLNPETGYLYVKIIRTQKLSDALIPAGVTNAIIQLEDGSGKVISKFNNNTDGVYTISGLVLNKTAGYRIRINILGRIYISKLMSAVPTPDIDNITWQLENGLIDVKVNTHDNTNNSRYYFYSYDETWKYTTPISAFIFNPNTNWVEERPTIINECYKTDFSKSILLTSSANLSQDIISDFSIAKIDPYSQRLQHRYSMLVKQSVISEDEYKFWQNLKKTTESVGTLFDPQPSSLYGNISCLTDPTEPVLGYFSSRTEKQKRVFISYPEIQQFLIKPPYKEFCTFDTIVAADIKIWSGTHYINWPVRNVNGDIIGFILGRKECMDCAIFDNGTYNKPAFW